MKRFALFLSVLAGLAWMAPPSALAQIPNNLNSIRIFGQGDYVSVGTGAGNVPTTFTVGLWFKSATPFSAGRLIGFGDHFVGNSGLRDRHIYMDSTGKVRFGVFGSTSFSIAISPVSYNDGLWHQATGTYSAASGAKLYLDGTLVGSAPAAVGALAYSGFWRVGYDSINGWAGMTADTGFNGQIDEAQIWTIERSAAAISSSWASALTGAEANLYSYLHCDEGIGTITADASSHTSGGASNEGALWGNAAWVVNITGRVTNGANGFSGVTMTALGTPTVSTAALAIPDVSSVDSTISVPSPNTIGSVKVAVDITHSFAGDLEITLIHPDGTQVRLRNSDLNDDSENLQTTYPDLTVPVGDLSTLNGKSATGTWRLRVRDAYAGDTGTLNGWSLSLGLPAVTTTATGDYSFTTIGSGSFTVAPQQAGFVFTPSSRTAAGGDTGVNFALASAFISGQVTANGVGLSGVTVTIGGFTTTTDANGNYRIDGLTPAANYTVTVSSPGFGFSQTQVTAGLGATNANFTVASYPISGRIVDSTGAGVGNVTVSAGAKSAVSVSDGTYTIAQVSPGAVTVTPGKPSVTFTPANRAVTIGPAATGVNFTAAQSPPTITSIADVTIAKGSSTGALRFTINDAETRAGLLQMSATSSDTTLVPVSSIAFAGVGSERTVTITPAATLNGTALITLTVTDESGLTATTSFNLRVNFAPLAGMGRALSFNGTNAAISVPANVISFKGNYSVECWLNTAANTGARTLVAQGSGAGLFSIGTDATGQIVVSNVWNTGVAFPFGAWHHLAVVKESANTRLYLDGVLRASRGSNIPFPAQSSLFQIGGFWQGSVDELRVWGVARTAAQIAQYQNVRVLGATPDLSGLWRFDETSATTAFDSSTNARHGTITAATRIQSPILFARYIIPEDGPITDTLQAYDPDSAALTYTLVTPPTRGTLVITDPATGAFTYTPTLNVNGDDPFVFSVSDGFASSAASLVTITITPDTNPPTISTIASRTVAEDTLLGPLAFTVGDIENAAANLTMTGSSSNTALVPAANMTFAGSGANRTVSILPAQDQNGTATITLTVSDGGRTTSTSFLLTVTPVNDAPTITALADQVTQPNTPTTAQTFTIADVDNAVTALTVTATSSNTALIPTVTLGGSGANRTVAVTPVGGISGTSTITVQVSDGSLTSTRTFQARVLVPPTIAVIANAVTSKNRGSAPIAITLADPDTVLSSLTLTATSSNPAVVSQSGFSFTGTGANRQLVLTPEPDRLGITTITVTVSDGTYTISTTFTLTVNLDPDYTFVPLPKLGGAETLVIIGNNNAGSIVGTRTVGNISKPVLWDTSGSTPTISLLTGLQDGTGISGAINERGQITGIFKPTGQANSQVFRYDNGAVTYLPVSGNGTIQAYDINESGTVVGFSSISAGNVFYYTDTTLVALNALAFPNLGSRIFVSNDGDILARNASSHIVRVTFDANLAPSTTDLGLFGGSAATVRGINARGDFVGTKQSLSAPLAYNYKTLTDFTAAVLAATTAAGGPAAVLDNINNSGEIAGHGTFDGTNNAPFLLTDGKVYPTARWLPANYVQPNTNSGVLINDYGDIAAVVEDNAGGQSLFMLRRQYNVGDPIAPPSGAINPLTNKAYQPPAVTALDGTDGTTTTQSYAWSDREQKLFFFRPISVKVTWITTTDLASQNPPPVVTRHLRLVWPSSPQIHVAGAPVNADPVNPASPYRAVAVKYSASTSPYDATTKAFTATQPGYSVIHYVLAPTLAPGALVPDPSIYDNYFQVVKTVTWDDAAVTSTQPATVATKVADPRGNTGSPKTGYTIFARAPYDGVGATRAYDRATQTGPIIPVNINRGASDALVVAFYKPNSLTKVDWADKPVAFNIAWPATSPSLAITNPEGSGPLPATQYPDKLIYNQPDPSLAGYNPNEEHAFFAPGSSGDALFALRNDLNRPNTSTNGVLLKWHDPVTGEWVMRVYQVNLTDSAHPRFLSFFDAGQELPPPYPLSLIPLCPDLSAVASGDAFKDYNGKFYAKAGPGAGAKNPEVVIHYYYKLQPGFFYSSGGDMNEGVPGQCVPWKTGSSTPVDVTFRIRWPADAPTLQLGETLLTSKRGLPSITNFANAQITFDSLNPDGTMPLTSSARLYDPLSARTLKLTDVTGVTAGYRFPSEIALQTVGGNQVFSGLPFVLRSRLSYDPVNKTLSFTGSIDSSVAGEPLLLTNVMSSKERDRVKQLSTEAKFKSIIDALYDLTRNPNKVNVEHPGDTTLQADKDLLIGFTTKYVTAAGTFYGAKPAGTILSATIVQEPLGALPKALTAGLPSSALPASFGKALSFNGSGYVSTRSTPRNAFPLTVTAWIKTSAVGFQSGILSQNIGYNLQLTGGHVHATYDGASASFTDLDGGAVNDNVWHHLALTVDGIGGNLYVDGVLKAQHAWIGTPDPYEPSTPPVIGSYVTNYIGLIDEVAVWNVAQGLGDIQANRYRQLFGGEPGLVNYWRFDETSGNMALDSAGQSDGTLIQGVTRVRSTIPIVNGTEAPRYLVIAENNDPALGGLPVTLHVIQVGGALFRGDVKVIFPDNVFDERLTLRHSSDFGGDPDPIDFEWWYHPDTSDFIPTALPTADANGVVTNTNGWIQYRPSTKGLNSITLGESGDSSLFVLQDNWFVMRYKGYTLNGQTNWGPWVGDPASTTLTRAAFAPGWIKRVIEGINPFEQRTKDFRQNAVNTYASLLISAGQRYEGPIALNASGSNLNSVGLIEAYTTVLERGESLSIDSGVDSDPANNALLLAASRVSDLYTILGNEAYADAADPTIGFDTAGQFGTGAPSIFAFQNQLDSLLDEELALLRGRDDSAAGVGAAPVYNRLFWNFTGSDGEVAYAQTYNISDQTHDGTINEFDARIMFPQGHGDAWGHYLTSLTNYYKLLRHPNFTWIPRPETTLIAGVAVQVDFLDERKFAKAAAAKARTGAQIVDLTYRLNYVEDPNGQYQGYKDTNTDRAWGVTEWARRAGQGAFLDYVTANTILPAQDPNPSHKGIQKIDRTTVSELDEIIAQHRSVQEQIDKADAGLNPLGIAPGAVPFDIDPSKVLSGQTHFDQIYSRAVAGVTNSLSLFNFANQLTQLLRRTQDTQDQMANNTNDKERDFKNRMIEVFGYPYAGDIGASGTYPSGYDGPDLYHYMYVDPTELTGEPGTLQTTKIGFFKGIDKVKDVTDAATGTQGALVQDESVKLFPADVGDPSVITLAQGQTFTVTYPFSTGDYGLVAPAAYGSRRAVGKLQTNLSDLLRAEAKLKQSATKYDLLLDQIDDQVAVLEAQFGYNATRITAKSAEFGTLTTLSALRVAAKGVQIGGKRAAEIAKGVTYAINDAVPQVVGLAVDALSAVRGGVDAAGIVVSTAFGIVADAAEFTEYGLGQAGDLTKNSVALSLEVASQQPDVLQKVKALEQLVRSEAQLRYELFDLKEGVRQSSANYLATLAQAQRLTEERIAFRRNVAATTQTARYNDATFRIFQNDALQKYRAQFDLAARYVYLAAKAYDYETCLLGGGSSSGQKFLTDIVRQRTLGQIVGGFPVSGSVGLADPLARLGQNFDVYRGQLGFNNPETETGRFSLRQELFRTKVAASGQADAVADANWKQALQASKVADLWQVPEFRKYCRPFAPESAGAQPGLVIAFSTNVTFGLNYFGWPLGGGDSAYDPSRFATKVRSAGVWFVKYNLAGLSNTPRVYLVPAGDDIMRSPSGTGQDIRTFSVIDQKLPVPFPIGSTDLSNRAWIPSNDTLGEDFGGIRRFSSFRAYHDSGSFTAAETIQDSRLIGRSVWNTRWLLIIPGGTFLNNPDDGLTTFINSISDIKVFFQTYSYSGN